MDSPLLKPKRWRNAVYVGWVKTLPCACGCGLDGGDPHHLRGVGAFSGLGIKADDILIMPLSRACHNRLHRTFDPAELVEQYDYIVATVRLALRLGVLELLDQPLAGDMRDSRDNPGLCYRLKDAARAGRIRVYRAG